MRPLARGSYRAVPGEWYGTPKEIWGFHVQSRSTSAVEAARDFLSANARLLGLTKQLDGISPRTGWQSLGAYHLIFQQQHLERRVNRGYVTVHVDRRGRVYMVKNRAAPAHLLPARWTQAFGREEVIAIARRRLRRRRGQTIPKGTERLWFPLRDRILPAWRVRLFHTDPAEDWIFHLDARTGRVLRRYDNLSRVRREESDIGRALVFDPSPVTALGDHKPLLRTKTRVRRPPPGAYREVGLQDLAGNGRLDGARVTTAPTGAPRRAKSPQNDFRCASHQRGFEEAMVYFHVDETIRYLESLGFRGPSRIFRAPVRVHVNGTRERNAWYSSTDRLLTFGVGGVDAAEDGETIVHELGHAVQDAITPDFGQSEEAAAMGEGFGDYLAASFFAERKPERYRSSIMTWFGLLTGVAEGRHPPCERRVDGRRSARSFEVEGDEHDNGEIWSGALWEIREAVGARVADTLIVESHFQLDGYTTFARGARAILDADENLYDGRHRGRLQGIFRRRHIGPL